MIRGKRERDALLCERRDADADADRLLCDGRSRLPARARSVAAVDHFPAWCTSRKPAICCGTRFRRVISFFIFSLLPFSSFRPFSHSLSQEVASGSTLGTEIKAVIDQGQIVKSRRPSRCCGTRWRASPGPFLIDGFPRSLENLKAFEAEMGRARAPSCSSSRCLRTRWRRGCSSAARPPDARTTTARRSSSASARLCATRCPSSSGCARPIACGWSTRARRRRWSLGACAARLTTSRLQ